LKEEMKNSNIEVLDVLETAYLECLAMLHPFMPFVTEAVYRVFRGQKKSLLQIDLH